MDIKDEQGLEGEVSTQPLAEKTTEDAYTNHDEALQGEMVEVMKKQEAVGSDRIEQTLANIIESVSGIEERIDQMNHVFTQKIQHTEHEQRIVDQMHAELQKYKADMYAQLVRPILLDLIDVRNSIKQMSRTYSLKPEGEQNIPLKNFSDYTYDIQDILEKNAVTIWDSNAEDDFNALKHRVIKKVGTSQEALHGMIAESLSSGYEYKGRTISPEKVVVYTYEKEETMEGVN